MPLTKLGRERLNNFTDSHARVTNDFNDIEPFDLGAPTGEMYVDGNLYIDIYCATRVGAGKLCYFHACLVSAPKELQGPASRSFCKSTLVTSKYVVVPWFVQPLLRRRGFLY
jgi:hypothetical protein